MNLTLKQLFKFGAVCTCACALSATAATNYVADSFEVSDGGSEDLAISQYKYTTEGTFDEITNYAWFAEAGDASTIVITNGTYDSYTGDGPIAGTSELMLNLETEGNTLSRTAGVAIASDSYVYVDTMIQFTPSEDEPTIDTADVKVALYVNAESNLVVKHTMYADPVGDDYSVSETNSVISAVTIDPEQWYRLSIAVYYDGFETFCRIALDGTVVSHANAYDYDADENGGTFFRSCVGDGADPLDKISFQGTGALDELVISDTDYAGTFSEATVIMLTLVNSGDGTVTFSTNGVTVTEVPSNTEVDMSVDDWYQMGTISGSDGSFTTSTNITEDQIQDFTATFAADNSSTVTVATAILAGGLDSGLGFDVDLESVALWALANGYVQDEVENNSADYLEGWLLGTTTNVAGTAELVIASIDVDPTADETTITVEATGDGDAVDFTALNGVVSVYTNTVLDTAFGLSDSYEVTASVHDTATVVVTNNLDGLFIKAVVVPVPLP